MYNSALYKSVLSIPLTMYAKTLHKYSVLRIFLHNDNTPDNYIKVCSQKMITFAKFLTR